MVLHYLVSTEPRVSRKNKSIIVWLAQNAELTRDFRLEKVHWSFPSLICHLINSSIPFLCQGTSVPKCTFLVVQLFLKIPDVLVSPESLFCSLQTLIRTRCLLIFGLWLFFLLIDPLPTLPWCTSLFIPGFRHGRRLLSHVLCPAWLSKVWRKAAFWLKARSRNHFFSSQFSPWCPWASHWTCNLVRMFLGKETILLLKKNMIFH